VILAAIAGAAVALRILLLPAAVQAYGAACFTMVAVIAAFAWGMWQIWLICATYALRATAATRLPVRRYADYVFLSLGIPEGDMCLTT